MCLPSASFSVQARRKSPALTSHLSHFASQLSALAVFLLILLVPFTANAKDLDNPRWQKAREMMVEEVIVDGGISNEAVRQAAVDAMNELEAAEDPLSFRL